MIQYQDQAIGETITGRDGNRTGTIKTYKENQIVANNRLLDYGDIDQTLETFLNYFQKRFYISLDLKDTQNKKTNSQEHRFTLQTKRYSRFS